MAIHYSQLLISHLKKSENGKNHNLSIKGKPFLNCIERFAESIFCTNKKPGILAYRVYCDK